MRQSLSVAIITVMALSLGGCDLFGGDDTPTAEESPAESPVVISPVPEASPEANPADPDELPEVPVDPEVATLPRDLDLIPSTNPDQRVQAIERERNDPFSLIPTTPSVAITTTETARPGQTSPGATPSPGGQSPNRRTATNQPTNRLPGGQSPNNQSPNRSPGGLAPIPNLVPQNPSTPTAVAPPPPQPVLARAVEVMGVVQIGSVPYAIVSAPNESSSRYVREGQRLSDGQVVVRRIEMNGPEPVVVFEQYGIEVITAVGEGGAPDTTEEAPAAVMPTSDPRQAG